MPELSSAKTTEQSQQPLATHSSGLTNETTAPGTHGAVLRLQRAIGNQATGRIIQTKLTVSMPGDFHEQEADRVADGILDSRSAIPVSGFPSQHAFQRKCAACEEKNGQCQNCAEEETVQRKAAVTGSSQSPPMTSVESLKETSRVGEGSIQESSLDATAGALPSLFAGGQPLPHFERTFFERRLGYDLGDVRIHTDAGAAESARAMNALAYTVGRDVVFADGQYSPGSLAGLRLMAHELAHVIQQTGPTAHQGTATIQKKEAPAPKAVQVDHVVISCADKTIVFETAVKSHSYKLEICQVTEGEYNAAVKVSGNKVRFELGDAAGKGKVFRFSFSIEPGQANPATLFKGQTTVPITATNLSLGKAQEVNAATEPSLKGAVETPYEAFKRLVRNAGKLRLANNRRSLEQWKDFLQKKLTPNQVQNQALAEDVRYLASQAEQKGTVDYLDQFGRTKNPLLREHQRGVITGEQCPSCHAILRAESYEKGLSEFEKKGPLWTPPADRLATIAQAESAAPSRRPTFAPEDKGTPAQQPSSSKQSAFPVAKAMSDSLSKIRPFLSQLGPAGYQVLPKGLTESNLGPTELLAEIIRNIEIRQANYLQLSRRIDEPDFDYMQLRPIVRDLLPLATPQVRAQVQSDIESAETWDTVKAIVIGAATIGLLLLTIFPPTSALGAAGLVALEAGVAAFGIYTGIESYEQGRLYALGRGANDVFDPEQQQAADALMVMGVLSVALSAVGAAGAGFRVVKLLRGVPKGAGALGALEGVEAEAGGNKISVSGMNSENPQVRITAPDGTVVKEGPLADVANPKTTVGQTAPAVEPTTVGPAKPVVKKLPLGGKPPKQTMAVKETLPEGYEDILDEPGISTRRSPGGGKPPERATAGTFAHKNLEKLEEMVKGRFEEFIPPNKLKPGLDPEHEIPVPEYKIKPRADRVDWQEAEVIEIKPDTPYWRKQGQVEAKQYAEWMNKFEERPDGRLWKPRVVHYDLNQLIKFLKSIGYLE